MSEYVSFLQREDKRIYFGGRENDGFTSKKLYYNLVSGRFSFKWEVGGASTAHRIRLFGLVLAEGFSMNFKFALVCSAAVINPHYLAASSALPTELSTLASTGRPCFIAQTCPPQTRLVAYLGLRRMQAKIRLVVAMETLAQQYGCICKMRTGPARYLIDAPLSDPCGTAIVWFEARSKGSPVGR